MAKRKTNKNEPIRVFYSDDFRNFSEVFRQYSKEDMCAYEVYEENVPFNDRTDFMLKAVESSIFTIAKARKCYNTGSFYTTKIKDGKEYLDMYVLCSTNKAVLDAFNFVLNSLGATTN